jgi:selenide,water dikinase
MGLIPAGAYKNREFREAMVDFAAGVDRQVQDALFDPQTSGGLLIGVSADKVDAMLALLQEHGNQDAAQIGEVVADACEKIVVV